MKKTGSEMPSADDATLPTDIAPAAEAVERARLQADVAEQRVRLAKDELRRARKRLKEAKREAKRARKLAAMARKDWKRARRQAKKDGTADTVKSPEPTVRRKAKPKRRKTVRTSNAGRSKRRARATRAARR
jgi:hypothetical protein